MIEALNYYFEAQGDVVERHGGDIDKFIGDALVAVFEGDGMEANAVRCAVEIVGALESLLVAHPEYDLGVGIGVASGEVVMGAMGAKDRMDFTVLGSTVNLSARLCSKAAPGQVLVDSSTRAAADGAAAYEALKPIPLKGYSNPVAVFAAHAGEND